MKKVWLAVALGVVGIMATSVFADVQNIRLSGDVRVRGYYVNAQYPPWWYGDVRQDNSFILQRTRVTCEADLEDHVLVVVTLKAEGQWGQGNWQTLSRSGTGMYSDRGWQVGVTEAYVQFNEMFFSPATLKLGRQYLHYGKGFVISSANETYNFDAGRLVLDFYPLTIDLVGAKITDGNDDFPYATGGHRGNNLLFVNAKYEMKDSIIKAIEAYFGWFSAAGGGGYSSSTWYYPHGWSTQNSSPWTIGLRASLAPIKGMELWAEGAYEGGANGLYDDGSIEAWMANAGIKYTFQDVKMEPALNAQYIYASGYSSGYVPFFPSFIGNNGYVFCPLLSNIHIFNVGASIKPAKNVTLAVQGYYYLIDDPGNSAYTDSIQHDFSGLGLYGYGKRELGWEIDGIVGYDYSKDVRFQLVYGVFLPDRAVKYANSVSAAAHLIRGEVNVKF